MSARRPRARAVPASSSRDSDLERRLDRVFCKVRAFVARVAPKLSRTTLLPGCATIHYERRSRKGFTGERSFMHVGHAPGKVCAIRPAAALSDQHLVGLFLHEFGHMAGGDSEPEANDWVKRKLGVEIFYRGPLDLQWVPPAVASGILG